MTQTFNEWWLALPEGRRQAILDDKWQLAAAAYAAAIASRDAEIAAMAAEVARLRASADRWNWMTEEKLDEFLEDYEMVGEDADGRDACHTPTEGERALIKDAVLGFMAEVDGAASQKGLAP